jgi:phosphate transport system substrate-binding protein
MQSLRWMMRAALVMGCSLGVLDQVQAELKVDKGLPSYAQTQGVSGTIKSVGSDTMNNLMTLWSEGFKKMYPSVKVEIEGKGSATAPPALIAGTADFGPMSRNLKKNEINDFETKFGYKPTELPAAIDILAVFVHKDNPIKSLTLEQVDAIFSLTRKLGGEKDIKTWGDLGLKGEWADKPISLYGRNAASGTYGYFKEHALGKGDYKPSVKEQPGSASVVQGVAKDKYAIGYSGIGYLTADVRPVPLAKGKGKPFPAEPVHAFAGEYPLARALNLTVNYKPNSKLDPLKREFIKYVLSREGQEDVVKEGFLPIPAKMAERSLKSAGLAPSK